MVRAKTELESCRVRSKTDRPCTRPAAVRVQWISFCEPCAREQEAYFAIGEFTEVSHRPCSGPSNEALAQILGQTWLEPGLAVRTGRNRSGFVSQK